MGSPVLCIGCSKMIVRICFLLGLRVHDCVGNDALAIDRGTTGTKNGERVLVGCVVLAQELGEGEKRVDVDCWEVVTPLDRRAQFPAESPVY